MNKTLTTNQSTASSSYQYYNPRKPLATTTLLAFAEANPIAGDIVEEDSDLIKYFSSNPIAKRQLRETIANEKITSLERIFYTLNLATSGRYKDAEDSAVDLLAKCEKSLILKAANKLMTQVALEDGNLILEKRISIFLDSIGRNKSIDSLVRTLYTIKFLQYAKDSRLIKSAIISSLAAILESSDIEIESCLSREEKERLKSSFFSAKIALQWFSEDEQDAYVREEADFILSEMI